MTENNARTLAQTARQRTAQMQATRPRVKGITVDAPGTRIMDDGFSIEKTREGGWVVKVSVVDLPALIPDGHPVEQTARERMDEAKTEKGQLQRLFPYEFLLNHASLRQGEPRPAVTVRMEMDSALNVTNTTIFRSMFLNKAQLSMDDVTDAVRNGDETVTEWVRFARRLHERRQQLIAETADEILSGQPGTNRPKPAKLAPQMQDGDLLVHEIMRLANREVAGFMKTHAVPAPIQTARAAVHSTRVSACLRFDEACNRRIDSMLNTLSDALPGCAHISSPMRHYRDYLTLKILGHALDGQACSAGLTEESGALRAQFNRTAGHTTNTQSYRSLWQHLQNTARTGNDAAFQILRDFCTRAGLHRPLVAEREMAVNGRAMHYAGLSLPRKGGGFHLAEAISPDPDEARATAAKRMIQTLEMSKK